MTLLPIRRLWADYFDSQGIQYAFFSAANATALQLGRKDALLSAGAQDPSSAAEDNEDPQKGDLDDDLLVESPAGTDPGEGTSDDEAYFSAEDGEELNDLRLKILSVPELEDWFLSMAPNLSGK